MIETAVALEDNASYAPPTPRRVVPYSSDWANNDAIPGGKEHILVVDDNL